MGFDKEASDLWVFGRSRPDLTAEQSFEASADFEATKASLSEAERARRQKLVDEHCERATAALIPMVLAMRAAMLPDGPPLPSG